MEKNAAQILSYWFGEMKDAGTLPTQSSIWFSAEPDTDDTIRRQFGKLWDEAAKGGLKEWEKDPASRIALIVLLDQFSRNMFRGTAKAFSMDPRALEISLKAISKGEHLKYKTVERVFLYLPLEHAENLAAQLLAVQLFKELNESAPAGLKTYTLDNLKYADRHREIIERFGRFPHRNSILGRKSTPEELQFLKEPMSSF